MSEDVRHLLLRFGTRDLERLVDPALERALASAIDAAGMDRQEWLAHCALATHGVALLRSQNARKGLFRLLPEDELGRVAEEFCGKSYAKPEDNALTVARLRWTANAEVVDYAARRFNLPYAFLPHAEAKAAAVQTVEVFEPLLPLHDYQEEVRRRIVENLQGSGHAALVQMPTGSGKTRTVIEALAAVWGNGLNGHCLVWLAHAEELCDQACETIERVWSERAHEAIRLVRYYGAHEPAPYAVPGSIVVGSIQKVYARMRRKARFTDELAALGAAVVMDEAHRAVAPSFYYVLEKLRGRGAALIGLSATPGRGLDRASENQQLAEVFDGRLVTPSGAAGLVSRLERDGVLARLRRQLLRTGVDVSLQEGTKEAIRLGFDYDGKVLRALAADPQRNKLILEIVEEHVKKGHPTIVFACTVEHARMLAAAFNLRGCRAAHVDGRMDRADRQFAIAGFREGEYDVLTNFGVLTTGFDAPRTRCIVIARPTTSAVLYGQMVGRALRGPRMGGGEESWVVDVRDNIARFGAVEEMYLAFDRFWGGEE